MRARAGRLTRLHNCCHRSVSRIPLRRPRAAQSSSVFSPTARMPWAVLGVAGHADGADDLARAIANLQAAALGKKLLAARGDEIAHEDRLLLGAKLHELGGAAHGERGIGFAVGHLEANHGAAVLLLERLHLASGLDDDDRKRPAFELGAAREDGIDEAIGLCKRNGGHESSRLTGVEVSAPTITQSARRLGGRFY